MSGQNPWDFSQYSESPGSAGPAPQQPQQQPSGPFTPGAPPAGQGAAGFAPADQGFGGAASATPFGPAGAVSTATPPTMFGAAAEPPQQLTTSRPPVLWLAVAAGLAVVGIVIALVLGGLPPVAIIAWALAGPIGIGVLAFFTTSDLKARASGVYLAQGWVKPLYWVAVVLCLAGAMVAAWKIAEWVGRL